MWVELTSLSHLPMQVLVHARHTGEVSGWVAQGGGGMPGDTSPVAPPGIGPKFTTLLGYVKWIALAAIILTFFAGITRFTAGRIGSHRENGSAGVGWMIGAGIGAVLYAVGYGVMIGLAQ